LIDANLNVPASDVVFSTARLWGKLPGSGVYDVPFGTMHNFQIQAAHTLKELMDPDFLTAVAVGTEKSEYSVSMQYARIRSRNLLAALGGDLSTSGASATLRTNLDIGPNSVGPVAFAAQILSSAAAQAPIIGTIYALLCNQFTLDFKMRDYVMPSLSAKAYLDSVTNKVMTLSLAGDETTDPGAVPATPVMTLSGDATLHAIVISWPAVAGATSYNIYRGTGAGGPFVYIGNTTAVSAVDTAVTTGTTYWYVMSAVSGAGESVTTAAASFVAP